LIRAHKERTCEHGRGGLNTGQELMYIQIMKRTQLYLPDSTWKAFDIRARQSVGLRIGLGYTLGVKLRTQVGFRAARTTTVSVSFAILGWVTGSF
jgi:hypothetical protein